jgi:hypothetical protein
MLIGAPLYDVDQRIDAGRVIHTSEVFTTGIFSADDVGGSIGGVIWLGAAEQDRLGRALDGVGDVTGDGFDDVVLGAPFADPVVDARVLAEAGSIYLIEGHAARGGAGMVSVSEVGLSVPGKELVGGEAGEHLGSSIADTGDIDGNGVDDFIVGAPDRDLSREEPDAGGVYLVLEGKPAQLSRPRPAGGASSGARGALILDKTIKLGPNPSDRIAARLSEEFPEGRCIHRVGTWCRERDL